MLYYVLFCRRFGLAARETAHNRKPLFAKLYAELGYVPRCVDFPFLLLHNYRPAGAPRAPQPGPKHINAQSIATKKEYGGHHRKIDGKSNTITYQACFNYCLKSVYSIR